MFDRIDPHLLPFIDSEARRLLQDGVLSVDDHQALLDEAKKKREAWESTLEPTKEQLLAFTHSDNQQHAASGRADGQFWEGLKAEWRAAQKPSDHPSVPIQLPPEPALSLPPPTESREPTEAELLEFMRPETRRTLEKPDLTPQQKAQMWQGAKKRWRAAYPPSPQTPIPDHPEIPVLGWGDPHRETEPPKKPASEFKGSADDGAPAGSAGSLSVFSQTSPAIEFAAPSHPIRRWFLAAAGAIAVWVLYAKVDVPLWLAIVTIGVFLTSAIIYPWVDRIKKRRWSFWVILALYGIAACFFIVSVHSGAQQKNEQQSAILAASPSPTVVPKPSPAPSRLAIASQSPSETPKVFSTSDVSIGLLQCNVSEYDNGYRTLKDAVCIAKNQQTGQEYVGTVGEEDVANINLPYGFYVVTIKAKGYITRVEAVKVGEQSGNVGVVLQKVR